jgi:serine/threonine protein phosphatase 1
MSGRIIAIGDIHGCATALARLLIAIQPEHEDVIVTLGDYIDRGPDSRRVLEQLIALRSGCRLVPLLGNHEEMLLAAIAGASPYGWISCGGAATLDSYGFAGDWQAIPQTHLDFLESCRWHYEIATHFFVHANYLPDLPLDRQPLEVMRWQTLHRSLPKPHFSGKIAVVGHTPQQNGEIFRSQHLWCIDTYCYGGGWLTALDVESGQTWQTNERGELREKHSPAM